MNYRQVLQTIDEIGGSISVMFDEERHLNEGMIKEVDGDGGK